MYAWHTYMQKHIRMSACMYAFVYIRVYPNDYVAPFKCLFMSLFERCSISTSWYLILNGLCGLVYPLSRFTLRPFYIPSVLTLFRSSDRPAVIFCAVLFIIKDYCGSMKSRVLRVREESYCSRKSRVICKTHFQNVMLYFLLILCTSILIALKYVTYYKLSDMQLSKFFQKKGIKI